MNLVLEDGMVFQGRAFGHVPSRPAFGEVVFNTGMVGYTESLTDPSYAGQILCFTFPLIGNYGVPAYREDEHGILKGFESGKIQVAGAIAAEVAEADTLSHYESVKSLSEWLEEEKVPGIQGIDTRELTLHLRERGVMMGAICRSEAEGKDKLSSTLSYSNTDFCPNVSCNSPRTYGKSVNGRVALIDCGVKLSIIRSLVVRGFEVYVLPYTSTTDDLRDLNADGVVLSNGPGDPKNCTSLVEMSETLIDCGIPLLGICLGTQIIALSQGADTFKLKYGHRGQNKPCLDLKTGKCLVTSQNHGYSVLPVSLNGTKLEAWFVNGDDKTIEGLMHKTKPCLSVQFHPEASPGPLDAGYVFDAFSERIRRHRN